MLDLSLVILTMISVVVSIVAIVLSFKAQKDANNISAIATELMLGQIEMQIREMISNARGQYEEIALKIESDEDNLIKHIAQSKLENLMNVYDEACAKYIDGKVDKERFRKLYFDEIKQLVENDNFKEYYKEPQTKYHATNKVYSEWNNREIG